MKASLLSTVLVAAALSLAPTGKAKAADYKMYAGSGCKVFGSTAWTDLQFGAAGITNLTSVPKNIICPIIKDSEAAWDAGVANAVYVHFHLRTGNNALTTTCNVYVNAYDGTLTNTYTVAVGGAPNTTYNNGLGPFDEGVVGFDHSQATMLCTLAAGARLNYYQVYEQVNGDS